MEIGQKYITRANGKMAAFFESTHEKPPLDFIVGNKNIMPALEEGVVGMEVGDTNTIKIIPEEASGSGHHELAMEVIKSDFPNNIKPTIGQKL